VTWRTGQPFYGLLWAAAANDQIAYHLQIPLFTVTWIFRVTVLTGPPLAFLVTKIICHALADRRHDEEVHGRDTGQIVMSPQGGYTEIREPAHRPPELAGTRKLAQGASAEAHGGTRPG
jgi:ubiquinol-cytochrome c reductase cytochrome b subunit